MKNLYMIQDGEVNLTTPEAEFDGQNNIKVYASDESQALALAQKYDTGLIGIDNVWIDGAPVAAVAE